MTSELRELVSVPIAPWLSTITTSRPAIASARATARPTTPAPTTAQSTRSMGALLRRQVAAFDRAAIPGDIAHDELAEILAAERGLLRAVGAVDAQQLRLPERGLDMPRQRGDHLLGRARGRGQAVPLRHRHVDAGLLQRRHIGH